jgi:hypothetical protein
MLYKEIKAFYDIHTKLLYKVWGPNLELLDVKLVVHIVTTDLQKLKFLL